MLTSGYLHAMIDFRTHLELLHAPSLVSVPDHVAGIFHAGNRTNLAPRLRSGRIQGPRIRTVVSASHKLYLEAYLHQMHDVRLVEVMPLLK